MIYNANVYNANSNDINDYNAKITEIENKIPNISSLAKKADYDIKITEIEKDLLTIIKTNILLL